MGERSVDLEDGKVNLCLTAELLHSRRKFIWKEIKIEESYMNKYSYIMQEERYACLYVFYKGILKFLKGHYK